MFDIVVVGHLEDNQEYEGALESLEERFRKQACQGGMGESGGCTDASVRLSTLLKVLSGAPCMSLGALFACPSVNCSWDCKHCARHVCVCAVYIPVHRVGHPAELCLPHTTVSMPVLICPFAGRLSGMLRPALSRAEHRTGCRCACPFWPRRGIRLSGTTRTLSRLTQMPRQLERSQLRAHQRRLSLKLEAEAGRSSELVQGVLLQELLAHRPFCCSTSLRTLRVHMLHRRQILRDLCIYTCAYGLRRLTIRDDGRSAQEQQA